MLFSIKNTKPQKLCAGWRPLKIALTQKHLNSHLPSKAFGLRQMAIEPLIIRNPYKFYLHRQRKQKSPNALRHSTHYSSPTKSDFQSNKVGLSARSASHIGESGLGGYKINTPFSFFFPAVNSFASHIISSLTFLLKIWRLGVWENIFPTESDFQLLRSPKSFELNSVPNSSTPRKTFNSVNFVNCFLWGVGGLPRYFKN